MSANAPGDAPFDSDTKPSFQRILGGFRSGWARYSGEWFPLIIHVPGSSSTADPGYDRTKNEVVSLVRLPFTYQVDSGFTVGGTLPRGDDAILFDFEQLRGDGLPAAFELFAFGHGVSICNFGPPATLRIGKNNRWQRIASVDKELFERHIPVLQNSYKR